ncbi:MAG: hypothetical protein JO235_12660 [Chroococcidiopsidaceae cyanobacterium CP_BM_RX_35]|nr:hypothetical protein [Chroococcidiopsidaceae cyanobacterium CP_BM_RX_35]
MSTQVDMIEELQQQRNISACAEILAGLKFEQDFIRQFLREEFMRESVIYQEILQKADRKAGRKAGRKKGQIWFCVY